VDRDNALWIGSSGGGLCTLRRGHDSFERVCPGFGRYDLGSERIRSLSRNPNGLIWVGTWGDGIYLHDPRSDRYSRYQRA
jgi:ligand-binding sensor domain-containing protein